MTTNAQESAVDAYQEWLAQMPRKSVRKRIADIEKLLEELPKELAFLKKLDELPITPSGPVAERAAAELPGPETPDASAGTETEVERPRRRRKLSPVRLHILQAVRELGPDASSPVEVAEATGKELALVQKTMSRMARVGQLVRVGHSQYDVPPADAEATLLGESSSNGTEEAMEP